MATDHHERGRAKVPVGISPQYVMPIYSKQPWESDAEYARLLVFLGLPAEDRTFKRAAIALGTSPGTISNWSTNLRWRERTEAFQAEEERHALIALEARRIAARTEQADAGQMMRRLGVAGISLVNPADLEVKDANALIVNGAKVESTALGLAERSELAVTVVNGADLDDAGRAALQAELLRRANELGGTVEYADASDQDDDA